MSFIELVANPGGNWRSVLLRHDITNERGSQQSSKWRHKTLNFRPSVRMFVGLRVFLSLSRAVDLIIYQTMARGASSDLVKRRHSNNRKEDAPYRSHAVSLFIPVLHPRRRLYITPPGQL